MFTGLVKEVGTVRSLARKRAGVELTVAAPETVAESALGDSINVAGVCQTVESVSVDAFVCTAIPETLSKTRLGQLRMGDRVNLETAIRAGSPMGGHVVSGHVDTVGQIVSSGQKGEAWELSVRFGQQFALWVVTHGSIAIDGVSLTVARKKVGQVTVALIPETLERTTLGSLKSGDGVNLEFDQMIKAVVQALTAVRQQSKGVTTELLARAGW